MKIDSKSFSENSSEFETSLKRPFVRRISPNRIPEPRGCATLSILIVSSDPATLAMVRHLIGEGLRDMGHRPLRLVFGGSAEEAIGILWMEDIQLLITDYNLPGLNGLQLIQQIKDRSGISKVLMTDDYLSSEESKLASEAGVEGIFQKPISREDLNRILTNLI